MVVSSSSSWTQRASLLTACAALVACGEANLGENIWAPPQDERWGAENAQASGAETLYSGSRVVLDFTVQEGSLFALLRTAESVGSFRFGVELVQCSVDACDTDLRTLWHGTHKDGAAYRHLLSRPPELFWVDEISSMVVGCSIDDCQDGPRELGPITWPSEIEVDAEFVYWVHDVDELVRCPRAGCPSSVQLEPRVGPVYYEGLARVERFGDSLYVGFDGGRRIVRVDAEGSEETLYETQQALSAFDVDGDGVYFATSLLLGSVLRCPLKGACGEPEVLAREQRWPESVLAAPDALVWANTSGNAVQLMQLLPGSSPVELTNRALRPDLIAVSDGHAYWAESTQQGTTIQRVAR